MGHRMYLGCTHWYSTPICSYNVGLLGTAQSGSMYKIYLEGKERLLASNSGCPSAGLRGWHWPLLLRAVASAKTSWTPIATQQCLRARFCYSQVARKTLLLSNTVRDSWIKVCQSCLPDKGRNRYEAWHHEPAT